MTTSTQQTVLTETEVACLRDVAEGRARGAADVDIQSLVAKGMLCPDALSADAVPANALSAEDRSSDHASRHTLTPAGHHAIHVGEPGMLPGIDE